MRIVNFEAENYKRLVAVEITPSGNVVEITGKNGAGKSSVLDAIYVALKGRAANPPKPIREGAEQCKIKLDLGELMVTRTFTRKEGGTYTDTLKVETDLGLRHPKPQLVLDDLLGEIGFDPFEFCQMKAVDQAETLLRMVPLPVDLDELAQMDESDYLKRRDLNRDLASYKTMRDSIPKQDVPEQLPDRAGLIEQLGNAANENAEIERERLRRETQRRGLEAYAPRVEALRERSDALRAESDELARKANEAEAEAKQGLADLNGLEPLDELVDTDALRQQIREAEAILEAAAQQRVRASHATKFEQLEADSKALTEAMEKREKQRQDALAKAKMPIEGLGFQIDEKGKPVVTFGGVPFEQASTAEQLRASTAIAMAANPSLRVLRVKDGSLLDEDSMNLLAEMAKAEDFQLWIERVGSGGVGIVIENGAIKPAESKAAKAKEAKQETLV